MDKSANRPKNGKAAVFTVGCRLNQADAALICDRLERDGWQIVRHDYDGQLDLLIVNSCSVTAAAAQKSRQAARRHRRRHPEACILVTGCSAEIDRQFWLEDAEADAIITNPEKKDIGALVAGFLEHKSIVSGKKMSLDEPVEIFREQAQGRFPFKSRALLKVQEGCNNFCSYCIVPYARGPERSRDKTEIIADFKQFIAAGFSEVVLTGVNICAYDDHGCRLPQLLSELSALPGDFRIRLSSTEPHPKNLGLLEIMRDNPKICRFLHLSLQHGADEVLQAMNRNYTTAEYAEFIRAAREKVPGIHLGTDIIVGFPGETDELFEKELRFVRKMAFANVHIFTFSPRAGTPAAAMPKTVPAHIAKQRYQHLSAIADVMKQQFIESQLNKELNVIFERKKPTGQFSGWSDNYINILCPAPAIKKNTLIRVITREVVGNSLIATLIKE